MLVDDDLQDHQAVHAALRQDREGSGLHQELSAGRARERRPVHARGDLVRHRAGRDGLADEAWRCFSHAQPGQPCARRRRRPSATASNPMSWPPTSIRPDAQAGRGGWTWYTGSAGWLYRAAVEASSASASRATGYPVEAGHCPATGTASRRRCDLPAAVYRIEVRRESRADRSRSIEVDGEQGRGLRHSSLRRRRRSRRSSVSRYRA